MSTRKLEISERVKASIIAACIVAGTFSIPALYLSYNSQKQICVEKADEDDLFINEDGVLCQRFAPGEHKIRISRNDALYHKIEIVEGYSNETEINGWRDNNTTIYTNTEPVVAVVTSMVGDKPICNDFGTVDVRQKTK